MIMAAFFCQALISGGILARIPDIQLGLGLGDGTLGTILTIGGVGSLASNLVSGRVTDWLGPRVVLLCGIPLLGLASVAAAAAPLPVLFGLAFLAQASLFTFTNVAMNVEADRVEAASGRKVMSRCHGLWSLGMLVASGIGVGARALHTTPVGHLGAATLATGLVAVAILAPMRPAPKAGDDISERRGFGWPTGQIVVLVCFALAGGLGQMATQQWSVIFMRDTFAAPDWVDTLTLPAYLVAMTACRILADGWIMRHGPVRVARVLTLLALIGTVAVAGAPRLEVALLGFAMIGFGTGVLFPLMMTAAARVQGRPASDSVASAVLLTGVVMMASPSAMGAIGEAAGLRWGYVATLPFYLVTLALSGAALRPSLRTTPRRAAP